MTFTIRLSVACQSSSRRSATFEPVRSRCSSIQPRSSSLSSGVIASKHFGAVGSHLNLAYEMTSGAKVQDNMTYAAGVDLRASSRFTVGADFLGRWNPDQDEIGSNVVDFALSAKWNPFTGMNAPFNAYIIVPVNKDQGLRSDLVYGVGFDFVL